ncbi:MAG: 50S ribosomal protein L40e [Candidatus Methanomethylicia archaeon]|nr:50S ribosomal protein L40e [Candidatus Methanomethylicia archaeon]MCX8169327.1 50S ribosomal protein L40e [Candidatus Methanomethylicia archaeon]MDW7988890.1 50S ribosomal protein L40e [Nitrososphaerota archaeon]
MPIQDPEALKIAQQRRLFLMICRECGARNPPNAIKCRRCKSKNLRWKKREKTK